MIGCIRKSFQRCGTCNENKPSMPRWESTQDSALMTQMVFFLSCLRCALHISSCFTIAWITAAARTRTLLIASSLNFSPSGVVVNVYMWSKMAWFFFRDAIRESNSEMPVSPDDSNKLKKANYIVECSVLTNVILQREHVCTERKYWQM